MSPAFHSWSQFWAMGGYGFYVWLSVFVALSVMVILIGHSTYQRRYLLASIATKQDREQRMMAAKKRKQNAEEPL
ncbi:heme exporter protein D [Rosenbergiella nectarea]|uniref:Heme exporter protein D n=1 Tax=Rosenbergiella nectarea TaxID=988801 RepID=A0A1H9LFZ8_9GAMM|nr:heme exporter protein CcmD [Rosenbergiella nectarea]SER10055.1 heme exporter protein D [Rosenbergiella nectarea]